MASFLEDLALLIDRGGAVKALSVVALALIIERSFVWQRGERRSPTERASNDRRGLHRRNPGHTTPPGATSMTDTTRSRLVLFGLLASPWFIGLSMFLACFSVGFELASKDRDYWSFVYGVIPWLSAHHNLDNLTNPTFHVDSLGLMALVATLLVVALLVWAFLYVTVGNADLGDRCHRCGYRIVGSAVSCPECGRPHPDPAVVKRRTGLGNIHRRLVLGVLLVLTIPGILWALTLVIRLRTASLVQPFGGAHRSGTTDLEHTLALAAWVLIALSTLAGALMLWRYRRDKSDGSPTPLLDALAAASVRTLWRMMGFVLVIWLNVALAVAMILGVNGINYVFVLSSAAFLLLFCFLIASVYSGYAQIRARRRART